MSDYLSVDIEIAKLPPNDADWDTVRPFGITCVGFAFREETRVFRAEGDQMTVEQIDEVVDNMRVAVERRWKILAWNGLGFDLSVLAEEASPDRAEWLCSIAVSDSHVDPMFHFLCEKGWPCGVQSACAGINLKGKLDGMTGADAPRLWQRNEPGDRDKVCAYVENDAAIQLRVTETAEYKREFKWVTKAGDHRKMPLRSGWRTTKDALTFPLPKTDWMTEPEKWARERFFKWTGFEAGVF